MLKITINWCQDVLTNDIEVQEAVAGRSVFEVNSASKGKMRVLSANILHDQPVQSGLIAPDVLYDEKRGEPVLGLEGRPVPEVTRAGPDPCEGEVRQSVNINAANIVNIVTFINHRGSNILFFIL